MRAFHLSFIVLALVATGCFARHRKPKAYFQPNDEPIATCGNTGSGSDALESAPLVFKAHCAACHSVTRDGTGPKLHGVLDIAPNEAWLGAYLRNEAKLLRKKEPFTVHLQHSKPVDYDHAFADLTDAEVEEIRAYMR